LALLRQLQNTYGRWPEFKVTDVVVMYSTALHNPDGATLYSFYCTVRYCTAVLAFANSRSHSQALLRLLPPVNGLGTCVPRIEPCDVVQCAGNYQCMPGSECVGGVCVPVGGKCPTTTVALCQSCDPDVDTCAADSGGCFGGECQPLDWPNAACM
jgi:hypothetical protein